AVAATLIESELFGHERGAFTGAVSARAGAFERAAGGTIFLDEIGELAPVPQPQLLRLLQSPEFRRGRGTKSIAANVRIVAATARDLAREVQQGSFREDLYFRLAVVMLDVPPLRKRIEDIPLIADVLLRSCDPSAPAMSSETLATLQSYD